jgi:tetratricopeptide (TPR) repeat protein
VKVIVVGGTAASNLSVDACLAVDANSTERQQIDRIIDLCTSALSEVGVSQSLLAELYKIRGIAFRNRGDLEMSLKDLNAAIELDKEKADHLRMRAWTSREMGRPAEKDYDLSLMIDPEWQGYLSRCVTRFDQGKFSGALEDCDKSLELRRLGDSLYFSAFSLHKLGRSDEALQRILEASKLDGALPEHFLLLAEVQIQLGQLSSAQDTANEALRRFHNDEDLRKDFTAMGL